jgi:YVTN family beta-propeller protein
MQKSWTLGRSNSRMDPGFRQVAMALAIAAALGFCGCGGGTSQSINNQPVNNQPPPPNGGSNAAPTIQALFPNCAPAGDPVQLQLAGLNFVASSVVRWNGSDLPTTMDAINGLTAQISVSEVAAAGTATVTVFNPGPGGGSSSPSTFTITTGAVDPQSIAVDPSGKFAYVASEGCDAEGYVSMYTINPTTGALASLGPPMPTNDENTDYVTVDPSGKYAYVASSGNVWDIDFGSILTVAINPTTGALTPTTGGINATGINGTPQLFNSVALDPSGKFAYAADGGAFPAGSFGGSSSVSMYTVSSTTGALTSIGMIAAEQPVSVAVDPSGKFVYVANENDAPGSIGSVSMYTINAKTGVLASIGTIAAGTDPVSVAVDPAGKFAYVANSGSNDVSMYTIDATTGALTYMGSIAAGTHPFSVAVDPAGKFAYVANWTGSDTDGSVSMYTIDPTTEGLTPVGTIATELSPTSIAIHPSGKFAYVTNSGSNSVSMYSIDSATGTLTLIGTIGT